MRATERYGRSMQNLALSGRIGKVFLCVFRQSSGWLMVALLWLTGLSTFAQITLTDSLKREIDHTTTDSSRVLLLSELSLQYRLSNPGMALNYGRQALQLARQIAFVRGEANALGSIGFVLREIGNLPNALKVEFKAYELAEDAGQTQEMARILNIIGNIYLDLKDFPQALSYYQRARRKHQQTHNETGLAITESNIGSTYEQMNQLDSAWTYEYRAYQNVLRLRLINNQPYVLRVLGNILAKRGQPGEAMRYYRQSQAVARKENNLRNEAFAHMAMAQLFQKTGPLDSSIYYARVSLNESHDGSFRRGVLAAGSLLARLYEPRQPDQALRYLKIADAAKDSLYGAEKVQALEAVAFEEQERQRDIGSAKLAYQQQTRQYALLIGLVLLLLIALLLWRNNLQKQRANALLFQQQTKIMQQTDQLTLMMQELHHRVKNNFAIVVSLLKLQSSRINDERAIREMQAGQQRIEAMSLIHQRLYQTDQVTSVNMNEYLIDLATSLMYAYGYNPDTFDLDLNIQQRTLDVDIAMPLGLIANELITNAFKHAYAQVEHPSLRVNLLNRDGITLEVQDNGPGVDVSSWKKYTKRSSFGKQLIASLGEQLDAQIDVNYRQGTCFSVHVPTVLQPAA